MNGTLLDPPLTLRADRSFPQVAPSESVVVGAHLACARESTSERTSGAREVRPYPRPETEMRRLTAAGGLFAIAARAVARQRGSASLAAVTPLPA